VSFGGLVSHSVTGGNGIQTGGWNRIGSDLQDRVWMIAGGHPCTNKIFSSKISPLIYRMVENLGRGFATRTFDTKYPNLSIVPVELYLFLNNNIYWKDISVDLTYIFIFLSLVLPFIFIFIFMKSQLCRPYIDLLFWQSKSKIKILNWLCSYALDYYSNDIFEQTK
jgi:hypothetical protein